MNAVACIQIPNIYADERPGVQVDLEPMPRTRPASGQQVKATLTDDQMAALAAMVKQGEAKTIADAVRRVVARGLA